MRFASPGMLAASAVLALAACDSAREIEQRSDAAACTQCHGFPPPPGLFARDLPHPQSTACRACHGATVVRGTELVPGGPHMNGTVDVVQHPVPYAKHPVDAIQGPSACGTCHGAAFDIPWNGRSCNSCHAELTFPAWQTNCTFCHGTRTADADLALLAPAEQARRAAPPRAVVQETADGRLVHETEPSYRGVGAHQAHLAGGAFSQGVQCTECHPARADLSHVDRAVQVQFGTLATTGGAATSWDGATCANYCHGATLPGPARPAVAWAPPSTLDCGSCHEANPTTGKHPAVLPAHGFQCRTCHGGTYTATVADKALHVKGTIDTAVITGWNAETRTCASACHSDPLQARPW